MLELLPIINIDIFSDLKNWIEVLINLLKTKEAYVAKIRISLFFSSIYHINTHFLIKNSLLFRHINSSYDKEVSKIKDMKIK